MKKEKRVIYYKNTLTDDFAGTSIKQKKISEKYNYVPKNFFFGVTSWFLYYIIAKPLVFLMVKIIYHQKFVNKKLIKKSKGKTKEPTSSKEPTIISKSASKAKDKLSPFSTICADKIGNIPINS